MNGGSRIQLRADFSRTSNRAADPADLAAMRNHVADVLGQARDAWDAMRQMERRLKYYPRLRRLPITVTFTELVRRDDTVRSVAVVTLEDQE